MKYAILTLQYASSIAFLVAGVLAYREWLRTRERGRFAIALAVALLGIIGLASHIKNVTGVSWRILAGVLIAGLLASTAALMEFRHSVVPMRRRLRWGAHALIVAVGVPSLFVEFPRYPGAHLGPVQLALTIGIWVVFLSVMSEAAVRFWRVAHARPAVERARLRLLSATYFAIVGVLVAALADPQPSRQDPYGVVMALAGCGIVVLAWGALLPPARLRARWLAAQVTRERERLLLTMPAIVWTTDEKMRITSSHGTALEALGTMPNEYVGFTMQEYYEAIGAGDTEFAALAVEMHRRALAGEKVVYDNDVGGPVFQNRIEPLIGPDGRIAGTVGLAVDITDRKHAEEAVRAALERERDAAQHLRALDEMKNAFLSAVSHELRTPLSAVVGFASTLEHEDRLTVDDRRLVIARLIAGANKLSTLLTDLLDLDRLARGLVEPRRRATDVGALARRVAEEWSIESNRTVRVEASRCVAAIDAPKVERIVENLLGNAAKYTPADTVVWVKVRAEREGVLLVVEDEGPGIEPTLRQSLFEPFRRGEAGSSSHAPGFGIGLSLVARFAELHGGTASVTEREGGGARFEVYLPGDSVDRRGPGRPWSDERDLAHTAAGEAL